MLGHLGINRSMGEQDLVALEHFILPKVIASGVVEPFNFFTLMASGISIISL